jgi:predicted membrane protein
LLLIGVGVLFLLDQLGEVDFGDIIGRYWPAIFILIGLSILIGNSFQNVGSGLFFILFGVFFLLLRLRVLHHEIWYYFWPVLIIALGLWILLKPAWSAAKKKIPELITDELRISQVFSGTKRRVESPEFKGGSAEVVFGSAEIDMTSARLAGGQATLVLSAVLGSIELRVPPDWQVIVEGTPVLGSIEQRKISPSDSEKKGTLTVKASVVLGSVHIKD